MSNGAEDRGGWECRGGDQGHSERRERIASQSEVIGAIVLANSLCCVSVCVGGGRPPPARLR